MPKWVPNPPKEEGYVYESGSYSVTVDDRDPDFAITMADSRARRKIQQYIETKMVSRVKEFVEKAGHGNIETSDASQVAAVSMGSLDVSGAEVMERKFMDGVMYSLLRWPLDYNKRQQILQAVRNGIYGHDASRSKFLAEKEWDELEKVLMDELDNTKPSE